MTNKEAKSSTSIATTMPIGEFMVGVKRNARRPDELITAVTVPVVSGYQGYSKVGVRNAMVIALATACIVVDTPGRTVRLAIGSVGTTIIRCTDAEAFAASAVDFDSGTASGDTVTRFGELAAAASRPIDDHRATADYRRHAIGVMAGRLLRRGFANV